jgi:hypothetical protein
MNTFLQTWKAVRSGDLNIISNLSLRNRPSLMDLNVELVNRMLTHCNFCRWNCQIDRSSDQTVGDGSEVGEKTSLTVFCSDVICRLQSGSSKYKFVLSGILFGLFEFYIFFGQFNHFGPNTNSIPST